MLSCNCLNIIIESETNDFQKVTSDSLNLTEDEKEDVFFKQEIQQVEKLGRISKQQSGLVLSRSVGSWITHQCLNCEVHTHAIHRDRGATCVLVSSILLRDESIANIRNGDLFSNIFNILVPQRTDCSGELEFEKYSPDVQLALGGLKQRAAEIVNIESALVEERIQQFTNQQYTELNQFKERARREQQTLISIILEKRYQPLDLSNMDSMPTSTPNARLSNEKVPVVSSNPNSSLSDKFKNKLLTSNKNNMNRKAVRQMSTPVSIDNSLDSEGLFQLEELEDITQECVSDQEESDNEESARGESARTPRTKSQSSSIAKSLPVNIPVFLSAFRGREVDDDQDEVLVSDDPHPSDIAASIKALAKSVHGDTVFGDLPRPRFSTQI